MSAVEGGYLTGHSRVSRYCGKRRWPPASSVTRSHGRGAQVAHCAKEVGQVLMRQGPQCPPSGSQEGLLRGAQWPGSIRRTPDQQVSASAQERSGKACFSPSLDQTASARAFPAQGRHWSPPELGHCTRPPPCRALAAE